MQGCECLVADSLCSKRQIGKQTAQDDQYCTSCTAADSLKRRTRNVIHLIHRPLHFSFPRSWSLTGPRCFKRRARSNSWEEGGERWNKRDWKSENKTEVGGKPIFSASHGLGYQPVAYLLFYLFFFIFFEGGWWVTGLRSHFIFFPRSPWRRSPWEKDSSSRALAGKKDGRWEIRGRSEEMEKCKKMGGRM